MDGMDLTEIESYVTTASSSGAPTVQLRNTTTTADMLSTKCSIDANELNSKDAATQPVINTFNDGVSWGDHLSIDVDIAGTSATGLGVILTFCLNQTAPAPVELALQTTLTSGNAALRTRDSRKGRIVKIHPF